MLNMHDMGARDECLWEPDAGLTSASGMKQFMEWLEAEKGLVFTDYAHLYQWSVCHLADFWASAAAFFQITFHTPPSSVLRMPASGIMGTTWFEGASLSYAAHVFRQRTAARPAIIAGSEGGGIREVSWVLLERQVASVAGWLRSVGVRPGDRVASLMPNIPENVAAFLAANSVGAVWSSCAPEFGKESILDRFGQIGPKVLFATDGYVYNGRTFTKAEEWLELKSSLPSVSHLVMLPQLQAEASLSGAVDWQDIIQDNPPALVFEQLPFDHPIWILYSSGTTGSPKAITHSTGGCLLEHLKVLAWHQDVRVGDRYFWYSTTGWMMWNYAMSSLLAGATLALYDGSPAYPVVDALWQFAQQAEITHVGMGAAYHIAGMKAGWSFPENAFPALRTIGSTGSPLPPEAFKWIYTSVKKDVWLISLSGGTDICSAFVGGSPLLPVYAGRMQCRMLGCDLEAYDASGKPVRNVLGEMVIRQPMPSMPVYFWNDPGNVRYHASYFEAYPGIWTHGDWIDISDDGSVAIHGRSDATLNRDGVRIGTSEIYGAVESVAEVADSLVVGIERKDGSYLMPLFVVLQAGAVADEGLQQRIRQAIRVRCSPRHVPDEIWAVPEIPYTLSGKKMEKPVKRILMGEDAGQVASRDTMKNPSSLDWYIHHAAGG